VYSASRKLWLNPTGCFLQSRNEEIVDTDQQQENRVYNKTHVLCTPYKKNKLLNGSNPNSRIYHNIP